MREHPRWLTTNQSGSVKVSTTAIDEYNIFDAAQELAAATSGSSVSFQVRRIIVKGGLVGTPTTTAYEVGATALLAAIYVIDSEDTDNTMLTTNRGDILEGGVERLLWTDCIPLHIIENPTANVSHAGFLPPFARIDVDLKVRVNIKFDSVLVLALQWATSVSTVLPASAYHGIHRALLVQR